MPPPIPDWLTSTLAADAAPGGALPPWIKPLEPGRIAGYASTARVGEGLNAAVRSAIERGPAPGTVLVAMGSPTDTRAVTGGIVAAWMAARGFTGLVTDGLVRDRGELASLPLGVWCRGLTPVASGKGEPGEIGVPVECGGVTVRPGDLVVADADGVVIWPAEKVEVYLEAAARRRARDAERLARVRAGQGPD